MADNWHILIPVFIYLILLCFVVLCTSQNKLKVIQPVVTLSLSEHNMMKPLLPQEILFFFLWNCFKINEITNLIRIFHTCTSIDILLLLLLLSECKYLQHWLAYCMLFNNGPHKVSFMTLIIHVGDIIPQYMLTDIMVGAFRCISVC